MATTYEDQYKRLKQYIDFGKKSPQYRAPWNDPKIKRKITIANKKLSWRIKQTEKGIFYFKSTKNKKVKWGNTKTNKGIFVPHFGPPNKKPKITVSKKGQVTVKYKQSAYKDDVQTFFIPMPKKYERDRKESDSWLERTRKKLDHKYGNLYEAYWITSDGRQITQAFQMNEYEPAESDYDILQKVTPDGDLLIGLAGLQVVTKKSPE